MVIEVYVLGIKFIEFNRVFISVYVVKVFYNKIFFVIFFENVIYYFFNFWKSLNLFILNFSKYSIMYVLGFLLWNKML